MSAVKKSEALKGVPVTSIEAVVDRAMEYLPTSLDLALPEHRMRVREWMVRICHVVVTENADSFAAAAQSAIQEAAALVINPDYHREKKRGMERRKAARALRQTVEKPKTRAEVAFHRLDDAAVKM
jgi:hypothetical protein